MVIQTINIMWVKQCHEAPIVDLNWKWSIQSIHMVISGMFLLFYPQYSFLYNVVPPPVLNWLINPMNTIVICES